MKKALITGITGQDGYYLTKLLFEKGYQIYGVVQRNSSENLLKIRQLAQEFDSGTTIAVYQADLSNSQDWIDLIEKVIPDEIYNFAAQSHVKDSFDLPEYTCNTTGLGVLRILEAIRTLELTDKVRFFQASSSEMFGNVIGSPQSENTPFHPRSPYGCAKVMAHHLTVHYREYYNMYACAGILYNHESPQRGENFVTRKITKTAARIKLGLQDTLELGDLSPRRDWGFAGDYVHAMWLMLQQEKAEDFVISSGETHSVQEFVEEAFGLLDLDWRDYVRSDIRHQRAAETQVLQGDSSNLRKKLGWKPTLSFRGLVRLMVETDFVLTQGENYANLDSITLNITSELKT